ncbi:MAG: AcrB/AcrD/AcrF family protein [Gemmatimonadetes bacterium]|nr:AcrB/AcrD/AcrF family protein [Gemmatimonadota bacterium]
MQQPVSTSRFAIATRRPVAILMVVLAVCVFGWVSYQRLSLNLMPDISYPTLTVRTEYPGTAPEEVETLLSRPLEQELGIVPHLVNISSISKAGQSDIILEFEWDTDMNAMSQEIREKADRVWLPQDAEKPLLLRYDPSLDPIIRIGLHGPQDLYALRYLAEHDIKRELEALVGVAAVKIKGGLEEEIHVALNERQIAVMGLDINQINNRLAQNNVNLPGGNLREGQVEYLIRTLNEFATVDEIAELIVARHGNADVHLRDIAKVGRSHKDREIITRVNGRESVEIEIYKEADANIVAVAERVRNALFGLPEQRAYVEQKTREAQEMAKRSEEQKRKEQEEARKKQEAAKADSTKKEEEQQKELQAKKQEEARKAMEHLRMTDFISHRLPPGAKLELLSDQSGFIKNSITEVQINALIGGTMAVLVLLVFLRNVVHTLIVGLTIPVSIMATFAPMYMFDVSLNIMSLGGLALGIGMLVDNSIVVLESIFRCREEGDDLVQATVRGTSEVGTAVLASTLTTITVFFPIVFVEGVAGQIFGDMALTVVFSLLASLGVALFFIPMLASRQIDRQGGLAEQIGRSDFLRLQALSRARTVLSEPGSRWRKAAQVALSLPHLIGEVLLRVGLAAATLVAAVLKGAFLLVAELLWWLIKPVEYFWFKRERTFQSWLGAWAAESRVGKWTFFERVWPGILGFESPRILGETAQRYWHWVNRSEHLAWKILKSLSLPLVLFYLVAMRFVFGTVLRLVGIVLQVVLMLVGLVLVLALCLLGMALMPVFLPLLFVFERGFGLVQQTYPALLGWALRQRLLIIGGALAALLICWYKLLPDLGTELIPQVHQAEFNLDLRLPVGTPLEETAEIVRQIEELAGEQPQVARIATTVGSDRSASSSAEEGEHTAQVTIRMQEGSSAAQEAALIRHLRDQVDEIPEIEVEVSHPALFSFKTPIEVEVRGYNLRQLRQLSLEAESRMASLPGLVDVKSSLQAGNPELQISYKRDQLATYGLSLRNVAELVRHKVQGKVATDFRQDERQIDVLVRLREEDRLGLDELQRLVINPNAPIPIPLSSVADIRVNEGPSEIRRIDQQRSAVVTANIQGIDLGTASGLIHDELSRMDFPMGFDFMISGQNEEMETSLQSLYFALVLAIFLVYVVMASQFESLVHPFVIMFTVPLALIGVVVALYLAQVALSVVVFIGLIMLAGIVVNNAIVLIDYINTLRRTGMEKTEAIIQAGAVRLRPITMTTATTVLGLLPMALGLGEGAEIRTPMALTVIAGLVSSTFLTLVVIPTVYSLVDRRA